MIGFETLCKDSGSLFTKIFKLVSANLSHNTKSASNNILFVQAKIQSDFEENQSLNYLCLTRIVIKKS